eukprot:scaffold596929_cov55-Attheya_sp.AAC.2
MNNNAPTLKIQAAGGAARGKKLGYNNSHNDVYIALSGMGGVHCEFASFSALLFLPRTARHTARSSKPLLSHCSKSRIHSSWMESFMP